MKQSAILLLVLVLFSTTLVGQWVPSPGEKQSAPIYIMNAFVHIGNGSVIENGIVAFNEGEIEIVADATTTRINPPENAVIMDAQGQHLYPGFINMVSLTGLLEINAVRATRDYREVGSLNPHVRSIIAYNTDSHVTPTIRSNGILMSQVIPYGSRIAGQSSVVQHDAWNWEDAAVKLDEGLMVNWPTRFKQQGWWANQGGIKDVDTYDKEVKELIDYFEQAKSYAQVDDQKQENIRFEAMRPVFDKDRTVYIWANAHEEIIDAIHLSKTFDISICLIGARDYEMTIELIQEENIPIILEPTHELPYLADENIDISFTTPSYLQENDVLFAITSGNFYGDQRNLPFQAGKAVTYGLDKEIAVQSITLNPAKILGIDKQYGSIEVGKNATLFISDGDALDVITNQVTNAFIDGRQVNLNNKQKDLYKKFSDKYDLEYGRY